MMSVGCDLCEERPMVEGVVDVLKVIINWLFFGEVTDEAEEAVDDKKSNS